MAEILTPDSFEGDSYLEKLQKLKSLQKKAQIAHDRRLALARTDYRHFAEYVMKDESSGSNIKLAPLHIKWIEHIYYAWSHGLHACILAPFGSGKTSHISVGVPLFLLGNNPSLRIIIVSSNDSIAGERLVLIRQYIENSEEYHELFPHIKADTDVGWTKHELFLKRPTMSKDPSLSARGATSSGIGKRADIIILDDINDAKNTIHQPKMRDVIWGNFTGVYLSRLEPGGKVLGIMCLAGDSPVETVDGGWKRLDELHPGDVLWSWKDNKKIPNKVKELIAQEVDDVFEVRTYNQKIVGNSEHPILISDGKSFRWTKIKDLKIKDRVVMSGVTKKVNPPVLSIDEAWLLGFMFGDGWITINKKKNLDKIRNKRYSTQSYVTCWAHGIDSLLEEQVLIKFKTLFRIVPKKTKFGYYRTEVANVGKWFIDKGLIGKSYSKRIPKYMFTQPETVKQSFINGFVAADGHITKENRVSVSLCNGSLVQDLKSLLNSIGYKTSNIHHRTGPNNAPNSKVDKVCHNFNVQWSLNMARIEQEFFTQKIVSIKPLPPDVVYDLSMEGEENFIAGGIVVHNTRWHEQDLVGKILENEEMRASYAFLIQRVAEDFESLECETIIPAHPKASPVKHRSDMENLFKLYENGVI